LKTILNLLQKCLPIIIKIQIVAHLDELSAGSSGLMNVTREGKTHEGRDIVQVVISTGVSTTRPVIFFECNIHAREWITSATCTWIIENLVKNYNVDPEITNLINQHDWRFVPVANPDGHDYTWTTVYEFRTINHYKLILK